MVTDLYLQTSTIIDKCKAESKELIDALRVAIKERDRCLLIYKAQEISAKIDGKMPKDWFENIAQQAEWDVVVSNLVTSLLDKYTEAINNVVKIKGDTGYLAACFLDQLMDEMKRK